MDTMIQKLEGLFNQHALAIVLILVGAYFARKIVMRLILKVVRRSIRHDRKHPSIDDERRERTVHEIINTGVGIAIYILAGLMILEEVGVNTAPLLAGAGIVGVALGFGAQSFVKDALNGLFIIFENQYRVGDVIMINNDIGGVVEKITLRETVMRDLDGMLHHIPNGFIDMATNMTMEFANVNIDIGIGYDSDLEKVEHVINKVGRDMAEDKEWQSSIIDPPSFLRVDQFADSAIIIKILGKTTADMRWSVAGEYRKRMKIAFDKNNIEIPFPQMVVHKNKSDQK